MELPKYIKDKIKQQNEACYKAAKLETEIDNWCDKSGIDIFGKEYVRNVRGSISEAVAPIDEEGLKKIVDEI